MLIPRGLLAVPADGGAEQVDVLVVGSGVAGLSAALAVPAGRSVLLATKDRLGHSATRYAQGGIAAVLDLVEDSVAEHVADTLIAGAGLCDPVAVELLASEGAQAIADLRARGVRFDQDPPGPGAAGGSGASTGADGALARTREGGHSRSRVVHANGDATGAELERALTEAVRATPSVRSVEHAFLVDLVAEDGRVTGILLWIDGRPRLVRAGAVVLASGGAGQLFADTTNPPLSTGDGIAAALRAGAVLADMEFVQFHPTALHIEGDPRPLISEAMRGEGAVLRDGAGERFMVGLHPLAELAPRDVVAKAITGVQLRDGVPHVWLDARSVPDVARRFPTITASCRAIGVDPVTDLIPVTPAAHYASGGLVTDLAGRTTVPGLYACGEVACTGVHGANRLASNSLLEGLVFAARIGAELVARLPRPADVRFPVAAPSGLLDPAGRRQVSDTMSARVGALRSGAGLAEATDRLAALAAGLGAVGPCVDSWEATDLLTVASAVTAAAAAREETRGCHWREDHPDTEEAWRVHLDIRLDPHGRLSVTRRPVGTPVVQPW
jgi:L-aspartate oxidase